MESEAHGARVIVAGGGVAGIAAAVALAERGVPVTLLETRRKLGGRATSHTDPESGTEIDNCQHVALGCCTGYLKLLRMLGVADLIEWHESQVWISRTREGVGRSTIRPGILPAPLHFTGSFLAAGFLTLAEKTRVARAMLAIRLARTDKWTGRTFGEFLRSCGQRSGELEMFWQPVVVSACNLPVEQVAATCALKVFRDGFMAPPPAASIGVPSVPLVRLYSGVQALLERAGGGVRLGASVEAIDQASATLASGERIIGEAVICALPPERAALALPDTDPRLPCLRAAEHSGIVGVHVTFDRPVMDIPHAVLPGRTTQWLFRKDAAGTQLHAVISAAGELLDWTGDRIVAQVAADTAEVFPLAKDAKVVRGLAVKERRATFAATPAFEALRAKLEHDAAGYPILAGDYTNTGWPATMEGATRSGFAAAESAWLRIGGVAR